MDDRTTDVERTLRRVVVGYRAVSSVWLVLLGVISVAGAEGPDRPGVVIATMVLAVGWSLVTIALHVRFPDLLRSWWFLAFDIGVAAWTLLAPDVAGSENFYGGYPMSPVFLAAYGRGMVGGLAAAVAMAAVQLSRIVGPADPTTSSAAVLIYVFAGAVAGWAIGVLREADRTRREAEAALAREQLVRARAEERAEMAAHLHDSVLQTLALIQRDSANESQVSSLARRQERELRAWLYGQGDGSSRGAFGEQMRSMCSGVEDTHHVPIDLVTVGDIAGEHDNGVAGASCPGGHRQCGKTLGSRPHCRLRGSTARSGHGVCAGSGAGLRLRRRSLRSQGDQGVDHEETRTERRSGVCPNEDRRRYRDRDGDRTMTVRVFIVDDHDLFRSGVRAGLGETVDIVGEASDVEAAVELINERTPDVVLLDVHMPAGGGKAVIEGVKHVNPSVEFLALSASDAAEDVVAIVRAGHAATLPRPSQPRISRRQSAEWRSAMPCSRHNWPGSCWKPSLRFPSPKSIRNSTS